MLIEDFIWLEEIIDKLADKHRVTVQETEEVFFNRPRFERVEKGQRPDEDVYSVSGQTNSGRYLVVFFIHKKDGRALIISCRDMDQKERRRYGR